MYIHLESVCLSCTLFISLQRWPSRFRFLRDFTFTSSFDFKFNRSVLYFDVF